MVTASIKDDLRSFSRSWVHHTGMQLATLTVLAATFTVVVFVLSLSLNLKQVIASWGSGVQLTVYLDEDASKERIESLKSDISSLSFVEKLEFIPSEAATASFKTQMASYAPGLLNDADFTNPFPASFRIGLKGGVKDDIDVQKLESLARTIDQLEGVEDVSYGQAWVKTYSSFVTTLTTSGGVIIAILLAGGLFVIGNSIRASISSRREEIEILELVGATSGMIRRPYVMEGLMMGALASGLALGLNLALYAWQMSVMSSSLALGRLTSQFNFLDLASSSLVIVVGAALGAFGAWLTVRGINDGWSARQRIEA